ncbi:MAG TPA: AAA-associated domain-containing protein, partial [Bryobacteraceae bacterium]|nr:AAA-associated domain-containing protein [Bryobacteraceae bacterium]
VLLADRVIVLGRNPARVRADFPIELAHPRDRKSTRFVELVDYIYKIMTQPDLALAAPTAAVTAQKPARQKYQMIPHARVGGIAGLLELLRDRGGKEDLYRLAADLILDAEDLLPIVEASVLLGFATLKEGDVEITAEGIRFAEADILTRKILFRQAALTHVVILQQIDSVLHAKTDHSIPEEFFYDILDEHFSEDEVRRQFETAMNWGRYAEIFDFDRTLHRLILAEPVSEPHPPTTTPVQS